MRKASSTTDAWSYLCCRYFAHSPFVDLHNGHKILYIATLYRAYLNPCVVFSFIGSSYFCKYWASNMLNPHMRDESQTQLLGNGIIHSESLIILCFWAQHSKAAEGVLETPFKPCLKQCTCMISSHGLAFPWPWPSKWLFHNREKHHLHPYHHLPTHTRSKIIS